MSYNALRKGRYTERGGEYLITFVVTRRQPLFSEFAVARALIDEMRLSEGEGHLRWLAWVVMPDHVHGLVRAGDTPLRKAIQQLKGRAARRINLLTHQHGSLWQPSFHDRALRRDEDRVVVARYIVANPLRDGLVRRLGDYPHWDAIWL